MTIRSIILLRKAPACIHRFLVLHPLLGQPLKVMICPAAMHRAAVDDRRSRALMKCGLSEAGITSYKAGQALHAVRSQVHLAGSHGACHLRRHAVIIRRHPEPRSSAEGTRRTHDYPTVRGMTRGLGAVRVGECDCHR
jgi:hypothetical protein